MSGQVELSKEGAWVRCVETRDKPGRGEELETDRQTYRPNKFNRICNGQTGKDNNYDKYRFHVLKHILFELEIDCNHPQREQ